MKKHRDYFSWIDHTSNGFGLVAAFALLLIAIFTTYETILRRFFDSPTIWVFPVSLFVMVWFPLLAAPLGIKEKKQITVDFLFSRLSTRLQIKLNIINYIISLLFVLVLGYFGWHMCMDALAKGITSEELLRYPKWLMFLVFPLATLFMALQIVRVVYFDIKQLLEMDPGDDASRPSKDSGIIAGYLILIGVGLVLLNAVPVAGIILLVLTLMIGGLPVAFALGNCGIAGLMIHYGGWDSLVMVPVIVHRSLDNFVLLALPMFIMGGIILNKSGAGERVFDLASSWFDFLPGGLAVGTIIACAFLSAMIGVSTAVAATIGLTAIPAMLSRNYSKELAYGSVAGGALGVLIPPSAGLIFYGYLTNSSVGKLFAAAFLPAFLIVGMFILYCIIYSLRRGNYQKVRSTWKDRMTHLKKSAVALSAPLVTLGGIYSGFFTPTEAAGVLVVHSIIISMLYKKMSWREYGAMLKESAQLGAVLMMIMVGGMVLTNLTARLQVASDITEWIVAAQISKELTVLAIFVLYLVLGMFLDGVSTTVLTVPILFPIMPVIGLDVIVFGVMLMIFSEVALLTPPVGLNLFMMQAITGDKLWPIFKGNVPFALLLLLGALLLYLFPDIALWLPNHFGI